MFKIITTALVTHLFLHQGVSVLATEVSTNDPDTTFTNLNFLSEWMSKFGDSVGNKIFSGNADKVQHTGCALKYVDCRLRGGYDPKDLCNHTCLYSMFLIVSKIFLQNN